MRNEDIAEAIVEVPEGHRHVRTTIVLRDGTSMTFQEASVASVLRAFVTVKTHPVKSRVVLRGREVPDAKEGYAVWQLIEEEDDGNV